MPVLKSALLIAGALLLSSSMHLARPWPPVSADELLEDGGFESGVLPWEIRGAAAVECEPRNDSQGVLGLKTDATGNAFGLLELTTGALAAETLTLSGYYYIAAGSPADLSVEIQTLDAGGGLLQRETTDLVAVEEYTPFSLVLDVASLSEVVRLRISLAAPDGGAIVCFDDLSLDAVLVQPPSPTPSPIASPTPDASPTSGATESASASPTATQTTAPSFVFLNGGFEDGLNGWQNHGGDLTLTSQAASGDGAGELSSSTSSTKWAFQSVAVEPGQTYQFEGQVRASGGDAYLRVSWYASDDASGRALSTVDSPETAGGGSGFAFLSTGPVTAPGDAHSARLRVMLSPHGGDAALVMDEFAFFETEMPTPTPLPTSTATVTSTNTPVAPTATSPAPVASESAGQPSVQAPAAEPDDAEAVPTRASTSASSTPRPSRTPNRVDQLVGAAMLPTSTPPAAGLKDGGATDRDDVDWAAIAIPALLVAIGGGFLAAKRR